MNPLRNHKSYLAAIGHRVSGIALALFLPFHFLLLGSALDGAQGLDRFLVYTDLTPVKVAEWGLVMMLSVHLFFGIRVLFLEFTRWPGHVNDLAGWVVPCCIAVLFVGTVFLIQVL